MKKKTLKKNRKRAVFIPLLLILLILSTSCEKEEDINKNELSSRVEKEENKKQDNEEEKTTNNDEKNKILKLDEGKDLIYDANYLDELEPYRAIDFEYDDYGEAIEKEVEVNFDNCKIPYINLDSNGAKKINDQILEYTKEYIFRDYKDGKEEEIAYEPMSYYKYELTDKYISIKFEYSIGMFEMPDKVKTYILDLETGEELSLEKAISISGVNEDFLGLVEGKIVEYYDDMLRFYEEFDANVSFLNFQAETLYNFWQDYYKENLTFYLSEKNELSLYLNYAVPMGGGIIQEELEIKAEDFPLEEEINPIYEYLAKEDYNSYEGGVAFLGYNSYETMETITSKTEGIIYNLGNQEKFSLSYFYQELDDGSYILDGDEFYLLTADYKNSVIKIYHPLYDHNGEMIFSEDSGSIYGPNCISFCNFSDIRPNTKVEFIYRDKSIEFTPSLSLMDSNYIDEIDGIIDLGDAYRELEERELFLELSSSIPYMWELFKMAELVD